MNIREALSMMAYREVSPGKWLKPIAYQCLSYYEVDNEWICWWTQGLPKKIAIWNCKEFSHDIGKFGTYLQQLKRFEFETRLQTNCNDSEFELGFQ